MYVVERPMNDWITDNFLALKKIRRKYESIWRRTRLTILFDLYKESCKAVKHAITESKAKITQQKISDCNGDQKKLYKIVDPLLGKNKITVLPEYSDPAILASNQLVRLNSTVELYYICSKTVVTTKTNLISAD